MRRAFPALPLLVLVLAGCSSTVASLPYKPEVQPVGASISAGYTVVADRLQVEIDTGGRRLERVQIVRPDGALLEAQTIEYRPPTSGGGSPVGIGLGVGSFGVMGGGVGTGVGVSTGTTVGGGGGMVGSTTSAWFPLAQAGPGPWRVRIKLQGVTVADVLGGAPAGSPPAPR